SASAKGGRGMCLTRRLLLANGCLAVGVLGQLLLQWHLASAEEIPFPSLNKRLAELSLVLPAEGGRWQGAEAPGKADLQGQRKFDVEEMLWRSYQKRGTSLALNLYMVYTRDGEDRKHHPEICIRDVAGAPEDTKARELLYLDAEKTRPVQRMRFRTGRDWI